MWNINIDIAGIRLCFNGVAIKRYPLSSKRKLLALCEVLNDIFTDFKF